MQECEKIVRRMAFLQAIEMGDPPSAAEGLDLDSMGKCAAVDGREMLLISRQWWRRSMMV